MRRALLLMLFLSVLQGALAYAALGSSPSSFEQNGIQMAARSIMPRSADSIAVYTVSQNRLASGTVVREYANLQGVVFAVSWNGPTLPDLQSLMGEQFTMLSNHSNPDAARAGTGAPQRQLALSPSDMMMVASSHQRNYVGRAWIPAALPPGFNTAVIE